MEFYRELRRVRKAAPIVQCITNYVTVNDCANMILAAGGSPTMAADVHEVEEVLDGADALVCNIGTITDTDAMILGGQAANRMKKPVILDPVAAGGTQFRRDAVKQLMQAVHFDVIRGNASEIRYLAGFDTRGSGVDVSEHDAVTEENLEQNMKTVCAFAKKCGNVIALSGVMDVISDGRRTVVLRNGCATMARITGSGCMLTALIGAFCGASGDVFAATVAAMAVMGIAGEIAEGLRLQKGTGNATFRTDLIDAVFNMTEEQLREGIRYEIFEG